MDINEILAYNFLSIGDFHLNLTDVIKIVVIILVTKVILEMITKVLHRFFSKNEIDAGRKYAALQFIKYIVYTIGILVAIESAGISLSVLWGGAAALLVGIGLGLQQTFNDLVSGIILLIEGSVEVNDIIEVDGNVGTVTAIGLRTSKVETFDKISLLIPNSKLVGDKATNWNHTKTPNRFKIDVGVSYDSDIDLVTKLLKEAALTHNSVLAIPEPDVQFQNFGSSSLDFTLLFHSYDYKRIGFVKSDMRYKIVHLFRKNKVEIPFPQLDMKIKNGLKSVDK